MERVLIVSLPPSGHRIDQIRYSGSHHVEEGNFFFTFLPHFYHFSRLFLISCIHSLYLAANRWIPARGQNVQQYLLLCIYSHKVPSLLFYTSGVKYGGIASLLQPKHSATPSQWQHVRHGRKTFLWRRRESFHSFLPSASLHAASCHQCAWQKTSSAVSISGKI